MAVGLPCAITRNLASEISIFDDKAVLFLERSSALAETLRDEEKLRRVASGGRRLIQTKLSLGTMVESYEQVYREVAEG